MRKILFIFFSSFLMAGCWDQNQLKDTRLVNGISFDTAEEPDKILGTVRAINVRSAGGGKFEVQDEFYFSENETVGQLEMDLQNKVSGRMNAGKAFIIIVGEEMAKTKGINSLLEPIIRSTRGYISSRIIICEGKGNDILSLKQNESPIVFEVDNLLLGGAKESYIPTETTFTVWNKITDNSIDVILPFIKKDNQNNLRLAGSALFKSDKFTGKTLTIGQTALLLTLRGDNKSRTKVIIESAELSQALTLAIENSKIKTDVVKENGKVTCHIKADLQARILSYYDGESPMNIKHLNKLSSKELTRKVKELTKILVEANSDALGIAKELSTKYPESWNPETWKHEYQQVEFKPEVNVEILGTYNLH
ncbi:Ger(x)C family spore germination protein [Mangrovibacillus sp. Mu-81]|uniref:Ger(x)C family spore germination protein n=1 Tax=Mangrovibacillus sp. Mu-81 TaxID=3121478 RepID=UPI002FE461A0